MALNTSDRNKTILIVTALLLLGVIAFANTRAIRSQTETSYQGSGFRSGNPEIELRGNLFLYVEGSDRLSGYFSSSLVSVLEREGVNVALSEEVLSKFENQTLVVGIQERSIRYNPFFPNSDIDVSFMYFSNGNTSFIDPLRNNEAIHFTTDYGPGLVQDGKLHLVDSSSGFASYNGYLDYLAEILAENLYTHLPKE